MPDPRPAVIELVEQDMRRALRYLSKPVDVPGRKAWAKAQVTAEMWNLFYPELSFVESDQEIIDVLALWEYRDGWQHRRWCVVQHLGVADQVVARRTEFASEKFGEALTPLEIAEVNFESEGEEVLA